MLRLTRYLWILLLMFSGNHADAAERVLTIEDATRLTTESNADLRALAASVEGARARLSGASLILQGNPTVSAAAGPRSSPSGQSLDYTIQIVQPLEIAGQRGLRIDADRASLEAAEAQLESLRTEVTAKVRERFGHAVAQGRRVQLEGEALTIARQVVDAADERFRAGAAALLEVNSARVEIGRAVRAFAQARRGQSEALGELRFLAGLDPTEAVALVDDLKPRDTPGDPVEMIQQALANRSELRAARRSLHAARAEARLASRDRVPTPRIGASYSREEEAGTSIFQGSLAFDLPLANRNIATRGVTAARVSQLEAELEGMARRIRQEVLTSRDRVETAHASADGYADDVVRAMQENMTLATESHRAGKIDFLQLAIIRRQALDARREYIDVLEEVSAAQTQLDRALGRRH